MSGLRHRVDQLADWGAEDIPYSWALCYLSAWLASPRPVTHTGLRLAKEYGWPEGWRDSASDDDR
jgi:hypothetical protein